MFAAGCTSPASKRAPRGPAAAVPSARFSLLEELELEARALGHLLGVKRSSPSDSARSTGSSTSWFARHGAPQLLVRHARLAQVLEQRQPGLALALAGHVRRAGPSASKSSATGTCSHVPAQPRASAPVRRFEA